jgi:hypothetical protein
MLVCRGPSSPESITPLECTEVRFASFFSGRFTTMAVIIPPERKQAKCTSVECIGDLDLKTKWEIQDGTTRARSVAMLGIRPDFDRGV